MDKEEEGKKGYTCESQIVQNIRNLTRPIITYWFSFSFVALTALVIVGGIVSGRMDYKDAIITLEGVGGVVTTILGYHFGKSANTDTSKIIK